MTISEVYESLKKHKFFGKYNGKYHQVNEDMKVYIVKIKYFNSAGGKEFCLGVNYKGEEFECFVSDSFWRDIKLTNGWI